MGVEWKKIGGWGYLDRLVKIALQVRFLVQCISIMIIGIVDLQLIISRKRKFRDIENFEKKKYNIIIVKEATCNGIFDRKRNG